MSEQGRSFYEQARGARRLLVLDLGFLGDTVHLIPALHEMRRAWPEAELSVMVAEHVQDILRVVPGVDRILGYPRFPTGPKCWEDLGRVRRLRAAGYDAVVNLNGSDRSSLLTWTTGARWRLGRVPPKPAAFWRHCFTHTVDTPHGGRPVFQQRWECLRLAGVPLGDKPTFAVSVPPEAALTAAEKLGDARGYVHISPFTTQDHKELPLAELAELINGLQADPAAPPVAVSCAPNERERGKLCALLEHVERPPWRVFAGNLSLLELVAVIGGASVHFGGDSGALHLALMTNTPTVSWFRDYAGKSEWLPPGPAHRVVLGEPSPDGLRGVAAAALLAAWHEPGSS